MKPFCTNCGSENLTWNCSTRNKSDVQEGRLRTGDVSVEFYLGCDDCSETVKVVSGDKIASFLNSRGPYVV